MTTASLKKRIMDLLEQRSDRYLLLEVHEMLASGTSAKELKQQLVAAVLEGEDDVKAGRSMALSTLEKRVKTSLRDRISKQEKGRKRA